MVAATYTLAVDWNNDGDYADANEDISAYFASLRCDRGREFPLALPGRGDAGAGRLTARLKNTDGRFSSYLTSGPLYGSILPGRPVKLQATYSAVTYDLWYGVLETLTPDLVDIKSAPWATLGALGRLSQLAAPEVSPAASAGALTGSLVTSVLNEAGIAAGFQSVEAGLTTTSRWYVGGQPAMQALRDLEATELGYVYEDQLGRIVFEDRSHRNTAAASVTSQATFSDAAAAALSYTSFAQHDAFDSVINEVIAEAPQFTLGSLAVLWTLAETGVTLGPGQTIEWLASYPNNDQSPGNAYVDAWTTPVAGTDIVVTGVASADLAIATSFAAGTAIPFKGANQMRVRVTNNHAINVATFTLVQARGVPVTKASPVRVLSEDTTSKAAYGRRQYNYAGPWLPSAATAQYYADYIRTKFAAPNPALTIGFCANNSNGLMIQALSRKISDRITLVSNTKTKAGISGDFFIESVSHELRGPNERTHWTYWGLSPAGIDNTWLLGTAGRTELGTTTILGF